MTALDLRDLVVTSVRDPATAARSLMDMHLPREALWTALVLVAVLNTLLYGISNLLVPGPSPLPAGLEAPGLYFAFVAGGLVLTIYAIFWTGRALGGQGQIGDVMVVIIWLQTLRVAVQVAALVLILISPLLSALLIFAAALLGVYILVHFVNQAHALGSLGKSAGVLIASVLAMVLALSLILSLVGAPFTGAETNV